MQNIDLGLLEHENMVEALVLMTGSAPNAQIVRRDGVTSMFTGLPLRLLNQILVTDATATDERVEAAVLAARDRDVRFVLNLRVGADDRFLPLTERLGLDSLTPEPWMPAMAWHPIGVGDAAAAPAHAEHEIREIRDAAGVADHLHVLERGFELPGGIFGAVVSPALRDAPNVTMYVGYADGVPITSGLGVRTGRTIGVYNIATVSEARKHGYGAEMTARVVRDGVAAGADVATLQPSDMGGPIYERMGFRTVLEYMGYVDTQ